MKPLRRTKEKVEISCNKEIEVFFFDLSDSLSFVTVLSF